MKNICYLILLLIITSCSQSDTETLKNINGYWEIATIENTAGQVKEFGMSQNIDFFQIKEDGTGVRKKVQPNALGQFTTSQSSENINVVNENDLLQLEYTTNFDTWRETVRKATKEELILINKDGLIYTYRRYKPLVIE